MRRGVDALDGVVQAFGATGLHHFAVGKNVRLAADVGITAMEVPADAGLHYATHYAANNLWPHLAPVAGSMYLNGGICSPSTPIDIFSRTLSRQGACHEGVIDSAL